MNNRPSSKTKYTSTRGAKSPLSVISKYYNKPSSKIDSTLVSGHYHGKCCTKHSSEKLLPVYAKPFSGIVKNQADSKSQEPGTPTLDYKDPPATLSEKNLHLNTKFDELSESIIGLATSSGSVGVRSLESLLTKEFQTSLGTEINDPKYSQEFFQSTRGLIEKLVHVYEEGKINPRLIKDPSLGFSRHKFLKANSATSVCYKDRYFKELVMNVLQSMCSNDLEEEIPPPPSIGLLSVASRERIQLIRDMVRVEAGLEPELFKQLDQKLENLRRSLSQNRLEMLRATKEVERVISVHLMKRSSSSCVEIPQAAKSALKKNYKKCDKNSECEMGCGINLALKGRERLESKNESEPAKNFLTSIETFGLDFCDDDVSKCKAPDPIEEIRSRMTSLVEEEILRMKKKIKTILKQDEVTDEASTIDDLPASSTESCDSRSDSEETDDEEIRMLIQLLKSDLIQDDMFVDKISSSILNNAVLESIEEGEMDFIKEDENDFPTNMKSGVERNRTKPGYKGVNNRKDRDMVNKVSLLNLSQSIPESEHPTSVDVISLQDEEKKKESILDRFQAKWWSSDESIASEILKEMKSSFVDSRKDRNMVNEDSLLNSSQSSPESEHPKSVDLESLQDEENKKESFFDRFKAKWWSSDESIASEILREIKSSFEKLDVQEISDDKNNCVLDSKKNRHEEDETLELQNEFDFTVEQMANALVKVIIKTNELTSFLTETDPNFPVQRKLLAFEVLKILEDCISNFEDSDSYDTESSLNDEKRIYLTVARISTAFSYLVDALNHTPPSLKSQPFSTLSPPQSVMRTLATLASMEYFQDCFISVILEDGQNYNNDRPSGHDDECLDVHLNRNQDVKIVKGYDMNKRTSSEEITKINPKLTTGSHSSIVRSVFRTKPEKPEDVPKNIANFEHYLGLSASVMTVQNVSDMFLYLSTVLNDVPHRIKGEKILSLNPPYSLERALDILYSEDEPRNVDKKVSFSSLTVQNVSDFFLQLSKTFEDAPPRVKNSNVLELEPPKSLVKAIKLLTSLQYNSILDSNSQGEILEEKESRSQDQFYDAVDTLTFMKCA